MNKRMEKIGDTVTTNQGALRLLLPYKFKKRQTYKKTIDGNTFRQVITYYFKSGLLYDIVVIRYSGIRHSYQLSEIKHNLTAEQLIHRLLR